jgi:SagB-type dehydrogenase family enzyme
MDRQPNQETAAAWRFHNATKYVRPEGDLREVEVRILMGEPPRLGPGIGEQDPAIEPLPYKIYTSLNPIPLPRDFPAPHLPAIDALAASGDLPEGRAVPDLATLARLCLRANGVLKRWRSPTGKEIEFRAAGCTGARYHLDLYLICGDLPGLEAGIYHYGAHDHSLRRLRAGDYRAVVVEATGEEPAISAAPVVAVWTSTFWRNAWRYQARAYRHVYWDTGTALANLLAVSADSRLPARVVLGFTDDAINALLGIDGAREAAVSLVALGRTDETSPAAPEVTPLDLPTQPLSSREIEFPEIGAMHAASSLAFGEEARAWRAEAFNPESPTSSASSIPMRPLAPEQLPADSIDEVIARRRSNRHYEAGTPLSFAALSTALLRSLPTVPMDCLLPGAPPHYTPYLIVNNVEGIDPGAYVVNTEEKALGPLHPSESLPLASQLACGQEYVDQAHVNVYALTDLGPVLAHFGNRGYRVAQLEAALFGARLQLAAHALGLGAVGSTSYDDEVTAYFSPHASDKSYMFVAVFGNRRRPSAEEIAAKSRFLQAGKPRAEHEGKKSD